MTSQIETLKTTVVTQKDEYLIKQRARNNRDVARTLKKFKRYFIQRAQIPLDDRLHPDPFRNVLLSILSHTDQYIDMLDNMDIHGIPIYQKELPLFFGK